MRYGYFDDENREYVITTPRTPLPWINYLGSENFFSLVSNTAGDTAFPGCKAAAADPLPLQQRPPDGEGHRFYIRDGGCVEPGLAARAHGAGLLPLPPRPGLHGNRGRKKRRGRQNRRCSCPWETTAR